MTGGQRRAHLWAWLALSLLLPAVVVAAAVLRRDETAAPSWPAPSGPTP